MLYGDQARCFEDEIRPTIKHKKKGMVGMASVGKDTNASQFYITTGDEIVSLDGKHTVRGHHTACASARCARERDLMPCLPCLTSMRDRTPRQVFGEVAEGWDTLERINEAFVDEDGRPLQNVRCVRRKKSRCVMCRRRACPNRVAMLLLLYWKVSSVHHDRFTVSSIRLYWTTRWTTLPGWRHTFPTPRRSSNASRTTPGLRTIGCPVKTPGMPCNISDTEHQPLHPCALSCRRGTSNTASMSTAEHDSGMWSGEYYSAWGAAYVGRWRR